MTRFDEETGRNADDAGQSRRALLGGAAGFVLAANGLLLPAGDEAAAREGVYGGRLGGRRGNDRRGIEKAKRRDRGDTGKRRDRGDKKDGGRNRPPRAGAGPFRDTALTVAFALPSGYPFSFSKTFYFRQKTGFDVYGPWQASSVDSNRYDPLRFRVGVLVRSQGAAGPGPDLFVDVRNHGFLPPIGNVYSGSGLDPTQDRLGTSLINEHLFELEVTIAGTFPRSVETQYSLNSGRTAGVKLTRNLDTERIEFALLVTGK